MGITGTASRMPTPPKAQATVAPAKTAAPARAPARPAPRATPARGTSSFADATPRGARNQLAPLDDYTSGIYVVKVNRTSKILREESKNPQPAESSIIEFEVISSNVPQCPVGYVASAVFTDKWFQDIYFSDVKGFMCGLLNVDDPRSIDENDWNMTFGRFDLVLDEQGQPIDGEALANAQAFYDEKVIGALVNVAVKFKLREGKHPITQYAWTANPEQHPDA